MTTPRFRTRTNRSGSSLTVEWEDGRVTIHTGMTTNEGREVIRVSVIPNNPEWEVDGNGIVRLLRHKKED